MTLLFYAQPYDISAEGFYFRDYAEYSRQAAKAKNQYGDKVEEFEPQFIDGDLIDCDLAKAWDVNQVNLARYFKVADEWNTEDKIRFILAIGECGYSFDADAITPDALDVDIYRLASMRDLAVEFVEEGLFGDIPERLQYYINYDALSRDLMMDYSEAIIAGERRFHAASKLTEEGIKDPLPCLVMEEGDDAKAIEASLAENIARLPMDEIDEYKAFARLAKQGLTVEEIASQFGVTELLVKKRLAIANIVAPILSLYQSGKIDAHALRDFTLATKAQQKKWLDLYKSEEETAPTGRNLKHWLFGGTEIPVDHALFDLDLYKGNIVTDLFGETRYFDDSAAFWELQSKAIASRRDTYLTDGWRDVIIGDIGDWFAEWNYVKTPKGKGGKVYVSIERNGEVTFHEGLITQEEFRKREKASKAKCKDAEEAKPSRPELTKAMQNYLDLHRHSAVRHALLGHQETALCLITAQLIAGSSLIEAYADKQAADKQEISASLQANAWEQAFAKEQQEIRKLLGLSDQDNDTLVYRKDDWGKCHDLHAIFATLRTLPKTDVLRILTFVTAETLPVSSETVEGLGQLLDVDVTKDWQNDDVFFDLLKDKETINAILKEIGGKTVADAHVTSTAKVQKGIIADYLDGTRKGEKEDWTPHYISFPMKTYTKRDAPDAIKRAKAVRKHYA